MNAVKIILILLCVTLLFAGCYSSVRVPYSDDAVLVYKLWGMDVQAQLTQEEAEMVAELLNGKKAERWFDYDDLQFKYYAYGCPLDENVTITMAGTTYYIGYDGCGTVRVGADENGPHLQLSYEEEQKICDLFRKYTGLERPY